MVAPSELPKLPSMPSIQTERLALSVGVAEVPVFLSLAMFFVVSGGSLPIDVELPWRVQITTGQGFESTLTQVLSADVTLVIRIILNSRFDQCAPR